MRSNLWQSLFFRASSSLAVVYLPASWACFATEGYHRKLPQIASTEAFVTAYAVPRISTSDQVAARLLSQLPGWLCKPPYVE